MLVGVNAALIDLFDTLVWSEWPVLRERLSSAIGIDRAVLVHAYEVTYEGRQTGAYGSAEGDMAALIRACGFDAVPAAVEALTDVVTEHLGDSVHLYDDSIGALALIPAGVTRHFGAEVV